MDRILFLNFENRVNFFNLVKNYSNYNWKQLAKYLQTSRSIIDSYKTGRLLLSKDRFEKLCLFLTIKEKEWFSKNIIIKSSNWGQIIGGKNAYLINKESFARARRNTALKHSNGSMLKYNFNLNMPLTEELCEFIGVFIRDGFTNRYKKPKYSSFMYEMQIVGDKVLDKEYYYYYRLRPICKKIFNIDPRIKEREDSIRLTIYSRRLFELLTERFFMPAGVKAHTVKIPQEIYKNPNYLKATLRGMFDTDGGVGIDKRKVYKKPYVRINYTSVSEELIEQVHKTLQQYEIPHSVHLDKNRKTRRIQINGEENVKNFLKEIGFSNPRHTQKIAYLQD